jgi:glycosyltransferase involved in cell wall biosynthesis
LKNLRILLLSPVGEIGGGEKVFLSLIEHLPKYKITPTLVCMRPGPLTNMAKQKGIEVYEFKNHRFRELPTVWQGIKWLIKVIREAEVQLVHANHAGHLYSSPATRFTNIPEVWHLHDYPYHCDWVDQLIIRLPTNRIIFTTNKVKSGYSHLHGLDHSVIPPSCIDPDYLCALNFEGNIRAKYNLPSGPLFLTVARLQEHKGQHYLINAVPTVLESYPNAIFVIVGKPSGHEQEHYMQKLMAQTQQLGIQDQVRFLGYVSEVDLASLYRESLALVHPAISEGFGLVLLEAMALGTPVIAAAADGPSELIIDGQTGLLVATADSNGLAQAMIRLLNTPDLVKAISKNCIATTNRFSVEKMVKSTVDVYKSLIR